MDWSVLASLPVEDRRRLVARLRRRAYRRDEVIFHQGDPADTLHLIAAGHVSVRVTLPGGEFVVVAILGPGDAFGEIALAGGPLRGATVTALETARLCHLAGTISNASGPRTPASTVSWWSSFPRGSKAEHPAARGAVCARRKAGIATAARFVRAV